MKIEFDKALLWLVPYLYLVSVAYYWGFWGSFEVDAFNYYPVSDLVKGVTAPLGKTLLVAIGFGTVAAILKKPTDEAILGASTRVVSTLVTTAILAAAISFIYKEHSPDNANSENVRTFRNMSAWIIALALLITGFIERRLPVISIINSSLRAAAMLFVVYLPCQAHIDGRSRAWLIEHDNEYDYIIADSLGSPKSVYKYLGKAGEYYFLLSQDNKKRIILPVSKLSPLIIEKYSVVDSASVRRLKAYQKELAGEVLKQAQLKQAAATPPPQRPVQPK